jgi:predicted Zn-dependent peptidase
MKYKKTTLKNGLRIITVPMKDTQTATVVVMVGVGSRYESEKEAGLSHFLEHMMFKGTEKRPSFLQISEELDSIGGLSNAFTGEDQTAYYVKADSKHLDKVMDVVSDIFLNSKLDQKEIDKEKGTIIQEINMIEDNPMRNVHDIFSELLFDGNPLGRNVFGSKKTVGSFKRKDFLKYLDKFYLANDAVVCVSGKFDEKKIIQKIKKYFAGMRKKRKPKFKKFIVDQKNSRIRIKYKKTDQTHFIIGNHAFGENHKDRFALGLLATILGGNMSSRLFSEVREKQGLAYYVRTFTGFSQDCGFIATQSGVEHEKLEKTVVTILGEYRKIMREKLEEKELQKAKDYVKGISVMGLEASDEVAMFFVEQGLKKKKIMTPKEIFAKIDKVTASDIMRVAKDIFKERTLNLAVIGPHKDNKKLEKILKL